MRSRSQEGFSELGNSEEISSVVAEWQSDKSGGLNVGVKFGEEIVVPVKFENPQVREFCQKFFGK